MDNLKQDIVNGAKQYADYITQQIPQIGETGVINYYFSGSLAMLLLNSAKMVKPLTLNSNGEIVSSNFAYEITDINRENFSKGIRTIGRDIDVMAVAKRPKGNFYELSKVVDNCNLATKLCPEWENGKGTFYYDFLNDDRDFDSYFAAELTLLDGSKFIISDPLVLVSHKFGECINYKMVGQRVWGKGNMSPALGKKYSKGIVDFATMFNGLIEHYKDVNFAIFLKGLYDNCIETELAGALFSSVSADYMNAFYNDVLDKINPENKNLLNDFIVSALNINKSLNKNSIK